MKALNLIILCFGLFYVATVSANVEKLSKAVAGDHRSENYVARDKYRNPVKTLNFFDIEPSHTVVEIWPARGYYAEILAPYLKKEGKYIAAQFDENDTQAGYRAKVRKQFDKKIAQNKVYSKVVTTSLVIDREEQRISSPAAKPESVDRVVTFRSSHGWYKYGVIDTAFEHFFEILKPGGKLGLVQHMADTDQDWQSQHLGYIGREYIISAALKAGFVLEAEAFFNRNPLDNKRYKEGVWQLPPTLRNAKTEQQRAPYLAIGESERMTLLFIKP